MRLAGLLCLVLLGGCSGTQHDRALGQGSVPSAAPVARALAQALPAASSPAAGPAVADSAAAAQVAVPAAPASAPAAAPSPPTAAAAAGSEPAGPEPFEQGDLWGYRGADGKVVLSPRFAMAEPFGPNGLAAVADDKGWAYINAKGQVLFRPLAIDNAPDELSEGLARFVENGKIGYFDEKGKVVIRAQYDFGSPFQDGRAEVCNGCVKEQDGEHYKMVGGAWSAIDRQGRVIEKLKGPSRSRP